MGKVISVRVSEAEEARIKGAAAVTGMAVSAYLKWLISNGRSGSQNETEMILRRLDDITTALANLAIVAPAERRAPPAVLPLRSTIVNRLKERGLPTSTIRQVEAVLDELEGKAARVPTAA